MKSGNPSFFHYLFRSENYKAYIKTASTGVVDSRLRLYTEDLYCLYSVVPPLPEQAAIVRYLDMATATIDTAIDHAHHQIELLQEYRTRLIADVVTGKLDVRGLTESLPEIDSLETEFGPVLKQKKAST